MTASDAAAQGFRALTTAYQLPAEQRLMDAVKRDLERGRIAYQVIEETPGHFAVWRKGWVELPDLTRSVTNRTRR